MVKIDLQKEGKEKLKLGWIHVLATFEIVGKPKEHVDKSSKQLLETLGKEERLFIIEKNFGKAKATGDNYFAAFAEVDLLVKDIETITWIAVNFTPSAIEIIEPLKFTFTALDIQTWSNDLLAHLHQVGFTYKTQSSEMAFLKHNLRQLIDNTMLLSLARSPKNFQALCKDTSLSKETAEPHLKALIEAKRVVEKAGLYILA